MSYDIGWAALNLLERLSSRWSLRLTAALFSLFFH